MRSIHAVSLAVALVLGCGAPKGDPNDHGGAQWDSLESQPTTTPAEAAAARGSHAIQHVFVVVLENHDWRSIDGSKSAPYLNSLLASAATAAAYHGPNDLHPSEPNYIWMEAGSSLAIQDDDDATENHRTTRAHLTRQLDDAAVSWKSYQEGIGGDACPLQSSGKYGAKHNPMVFFDDVTDGGDRYSRHCIEHVRPYGELAADLANDTVPAYSFITPDLCHDMHDNKGCETGDPVKNGDLWLSRELPKILASKAYQSGGALFITWDENEHDDQSVGMMVLSPFAKSGYVNHVPYTHSSLLRSLQDIFAVRPYIRDAVNAAPLDDLFVRYP